jgi:hypothetical protein
LGLSFPANTGEFQPVFVPMASNPRQTGVLPASPEGVPTCIWDLTSFCLLRGLLYNFSLLHVLANFIDNGDGDDDSSMYKQYTESSDKPEEQLLVFSLYR